MWSVSVLLWGCYWASVLASPISLSSTSSVNATESDCVGINSLSPRCKPVEANHRREVFYVGGHYQLDTQTQQHFLVDQLYVEKLTPFPSPHQRHPLVFFHGGGYSGTVSFNVNGSDDSIYSALMSILSTGMATNTRRAPRIRVLFLAKRIPSLPHRPGRHRTLNPGRSNRLPHQSRAKF